MSWWKLADVYPKLNRMREKMAKLICHTSKLKCDDVRLKGLTPSNRVCTDCNMYAVENV